MAWPARQDDVTAQNAAQPRRKVAFCAVDANRLSVVSCDALRRKRRKRR
jgi:hypothetical protein